MSAHLYELLKQRAARHPDAVAIGGQQGLVWKSLTGRELLDRVDRLAVELAALGVSDGDRVVYWLPNHWRTPVYLFAAWKLGAIIVPFDREMNPEGGARILAGVEPRLIVAGYGERPAWAGTADITEWWEPGSRGGAPPATPWTEPSEPIAVIVFTSGTTGTPKGVMLTHTNLIFQAGAVADRIPLDRSCRLAGILPLSHAFELGTLMYAIEAGAATHYVPSRRGPDILRVLQEQQITHMIVVPQVLTMMGRALQEQLQASVPAALYRAMMAIADRLPFATRRLLFRPVHRRLGGRLRLFIAGGAALPTETHRLWERLGVRVVQGFGVTECSPAIAIAAPDGSAPVGSVGPSLRGVEVRLSPEGELLVRGPNVMAGYWRDPERTAEVVHDGWYATGDLGTIDARGNIRIVGRARDLIVLPSGMNVWPHDVEDVLRGHPSVKDAAVVAVPTAGGGAALHAYLLPTSASDRATNVSRIVAEANARLAQHQRVATASWWEGADFPRTALLKVKRHLIPVPAPERAIVVESVLPSDDPVGQAIGGIAKVSTVQPAQTLAQLGLDSLSLVELAIALEEKTGKVVHEDTLRTEMTVDEVRAALQAAPARVDGVEGAEPDRRRMSIVPPTWLYTWGRPFRLLGTPFDWLLRYAGRPIVVLGLEHLDALPDRVILAGTHRSFADMSLVRYALSRSKSRGLLAKLITANAVKPNVTGSFAWAGVLVLGLHPVDQHLGREVSLRALTRTAKATGGSILIFPQGTHSTSEAELANDPSVRFRAGVAHLAEALDLPVVPFGLAGPERVIQPSPEAFDGFKIGGMPVSIHRAPLAIGFGPPLRLGPDETAQAFAARLEEVCAALTREAERAIADRCAGGPLPKDSAPARTNREGAFAHAESAFVHAGDGDAKRKLANGAHGG
jgi:long-chain acyl-CoA synthetase